MNEMQKRARWMWNAMNRKNKLKYCYQNIATGIVTSQDMLTLDMCRMMDWILDDLQISAEELTSADVNEWAMNNL